MPIGTISGRHASASHRVRAVYDASVFPKTEVKLSIDPADVRALFDGLQLDRVKDVRRRRVVFFDTATQELRQAGLLLRARFGDGGDDVTLKARGPIGVRAALALRGDADAKAELDHTSRGLLPSVSLGDDVSDKRIRDVLAGRHGARTIVGPKQERVLEDLLGHRPPWQRLQALGPAEITAWKLKPAGMSEDIVVELWRLPNGRQVVEVSAKDKSARGAALAAELQALLRRLGVDPSNAQETKTQALYDAWSPAAG